MEVRSSLEDAGRWRLARSISPVMSEPLTGRWIMDSSIAAEPEMLMECARVSWSSGADGRVGALIRSGVDWDRLVEMARAHAVAPLLYRRLQSLRSEKVPGDVLDRLRGHVQHLRLRNLFLSGELIRLLDELAARGIRAIPYKGPVLTALAYGDLALREFGDLDLLVPEADVREAREVLVSFGYRPEHRLTPAQEAAFLRYDRECSYYREDGSAVELHWTVSQRYVPLPLDFEELWGRAMRVPLGGRAVPTFPPEDLILILAVHGGAHLWTRLGWIRDIAELTGSFEEPDWERLLERAGALKCRRMLLLGLFLANEVAGADLPEDVLRTARADAAVLDLAGDVRERLFSEEQIPQGILGIRAFQPFHLKMMDRSRDRLRYLAYQATSPTLQEWQLLPLPAALFPLYYLLRPLRLTGSAGWRKLRAVAQSRKFENGEEDRVER